MIPAPAAEQWFPEDYIHGDRFAALADIHVHPDPAPIPVRAADAGQILYCMTDRVPELFEVLRQRRQPCILITHNADFQVTASMVASKPGCVRHWFAQNTLVEHPDVTPLPIGLERPHVSGGRTRPEAFANTIRQANSIRNLAYLNFSDWTNRRERMPIRWALAWRNWVTAPRGVRPLEQYLIEVREHRSVISPRGNGEDCHRTWEALYLGVIPLVRNTPAMRSFARLLPIALFDSLVMLTRRSVEEEIAKALDRAGRGWPERLRLSWWERRILKIRDELLGA